MSAPLHRLLTLLFVLALALPYAACDSGDPDSDTPAPGLPGGPGGEEGGEDTEEGDEEEEAENQEPPEEGEIGGAFRVELEPVNPLFGGVTDTFTGSAVFYTIEESGRFVIALADDDVLDVAYPFEFVVFSTPDGRPEPGSYVLTLDLESSFTGGYAQVRGVDFIDVDLPLTEEVYRLPPSTILQTFSGTLVIEQSSEERITGTLTFRGFPVDTQNPPLYVRGESVASGSFEAVFVTEADAPDIDLELYLPETFELP